MGNISRRRASFLQCQRGDSTNFKKRVGSALPSTLTLPNPQTQRVGIDTAPEEAVEVSDLPSCYVNLKEKENEAPTHKMSTANFERTRS